MNFDKKFQPIKNQVNNEFLGGQELPNNTLNAYKALQMSHKSYYNQQEPHNKNMLNQSKLEKKGKTDKKTEKNRKKTSPKFEICGSVRFFGVATPPPPPMREPVYSLLPTKRFDKGAVIMNFCICNCKNRAEKDLFLQISVCFVKEYPTEMWTNLPLTKAKFEKT